MRTRNKIIYKLCYNYNMRVENIEIIKKIIKNYFQNAEIYIFGSRTDDTKKGGDLDIFIIPNKKLPIRQRRILKRELELELEKSFTYPIDITISKDTNRDIEKEALKGIKIV